MGEGHFHCMIVEDGYEPYLISEPIVNIQRTTIMGIGDCDLIGSLGGVRKSYTAILQRKERETAPSAQQQQQQQQQQTVIIPTSGEGNSFGKVIISCDLEEAEIYVDGMFVGNAPATLNLKDGIHILEIKSMGYNNYRKELRIMGGSEISLRAKLKP